MGRERTLLERIAAGGGRAAARHDDTKEDLNALLESVRKRLIVLFNSRHGMSQAQPDYGLPAMVDVTVGTSDYVGAVQSAIRTTVEKYEPRLTRVRVTHQVEESQAHLGRKLVFRIEGVLIGRDGEHRVWYQTAMTSTGQFAVAD